MSAPVPLVVTNVTREKVLADRALEARSFFARFKGLMGRKDFPFGEGLWIIPCNSIHTFFMRLPIDVLFLDSGLTVVKAFPALRPWRATSVYFKAKSVLELPAGVLHGSDTQSGDRLEIKGL